MPIKNVWLIDKGIDAETGNQVASQYAARLEGVDVTYFAGNDCYDEASRELVDSPGLVVAAIGALNTSFGMIGDNPSIVEPYKAMLRFVLQCADNLQRDAPLYVVQSWHNDQEGYVVKAEQANDFVVSRGNHLDRTLRLLRSMQGMRIS